MSGPSLWERLKHARLVQVLVTYLAASWVVLQIVEILQESLELPAWVLPVSFVLLLVGLLIVAATAWVQGAARPVTSGEAGRTGAGRAGASGEPGAVGAGDAAGGDSGRGPRVGSASEAPGSWDVAPGDLLRSLSRGRLPHLTWGRALAGGAFAFAMLFGLAGLYVLVQDRGKSLAPPEAIAGEDAAPALSVLPFEVRGEGLEVWREGMVDALSTNLDGAADLRAIDSRTVLARWRESVEGETSPDLQTSIGIARATGARWALVGNVIAAGSGVRLSATVHDVATGEALGEGQVEGPQEEIFGLVDELSIRVLRSLFSDPGTDFSFDLARLTTHSVPALKVYLEAEERYRGGDFEAAIPLYRRALEEDSTFGLAYYRLSETYGWSAGIGSADQREALEKAVALADRMPEREALLLRVKRGLLTGDFRMVDTLRAAVRRYPDDAEAWYLLADTYLHSGARLPSNLEEIEEAFSRAVELEPGFAPYLLHWVDLGMWWEPDSAEAVARLERLRRQSSDSRNLGDREAAFDLAFGDSATRAARRAALDTADTGATRRLVDNHLFHARFAPQRETVLAAAVERMPAAERRWPALRLFFTAAYGRGQVQRGIGLLEDPAIDPAARACELWEARVMGLPVPEERVDAALAAAPRDALGNPCVWVADGVSAADEGRWEAHARAREGLRENLAAWMEETSPDSATREGANRFIDNRLRTLEGYAQWRRGDPERAVQTLEEAADGGQEVVRWWLARLSAELGRNAEAVSWLRSFYWDEHTLAHYRLGKVYEELGEPERARDAYRYFVEGWYEADPELQPMVEEARQAIARLMDAPAS